MTPGQLPGIPGPKPRRVPRPPGKGVNGRAEPVYRSPSSLPLRWRNLVDPDRVIINVTIPGRPIPKGRPRMSQATVDAWGNVRQGHAYTPARTKNAEETMAWIMRRTRILTEPVDHPVGILAFFRLPGSLSGGDSDNLLKLLLDSGNGVVWADDRKIKEAHVFVEDYSTEPGTDLLAWTAPARRRTPGR